MAKGKKSARGRAKKGRRTKRSSGGISVKDTAACFKRLTSCGTSPSIANYYCKDGNQKFKGMVRAAKSNAVAAQSEARVAAERAVHAAKQQVKAANASYTKFKKARAQILGSCAK